MLGFGDGGFGVFEDFAFVVADEGALFVAHEDVVGVDGDFAAAAGGVDDELGDGVAGGVTAEGFDDFNAFVDGGAEVGGALDEVALVEVVGADAAHEEFVHEGLHDVGLVVDATEEDALVAKGDAVIGEALEAGADFGGEFAGVIGVDADEEGVVFLQHLAKRGGDALGEEDGDAGTDADELDVGDGAEAREDALELGVGEEEGIATGEEDVADFGMGFEVAEGGFEFGVEFLFAGAGDDAAAGAVTTVGGAAVGDEEEDAVWVAMDEAGDGHVGVLAAGVGHFGRVFPGFFDAGDDLAADGAVRVGGVDEVEVVGGDCHGQLIAGEEDAGAFFFGENEVLFELGEGGDAVFELPGGGIPLLLGDAGVFPVAETWAGEGFFGEVGGGAGTGEGRGLFGPGFNRGQAIQQERVGHVMGVLRRWSVHRDLAACQMNGEGVPGRIGLAGSLR